MPRRTSTTALIALALASAAPPAGAAVDAWSTGVQPGGRVGAIAVAGARAFAGASGGGEGGSLFRSTDGGATWRRVAGMGNHDVVDVEIDPAAGQPVYAATQEGLLRSLDGGATWAEIDGASVPAHGFWSVVAVDRGRPGTAFFGRWSSAGAGVWRTASGGTGTWTDVSGGLGVLPFLNGITVDPATHWAWGWRSGVGVSVLTDGATAWAAANNGLPSTSVNGIAIDGPGNRAVVVTASGAAWLPSGGGPKWFALNAGLSSTYLLSASADAAGNVYATTLDHATWRLPSGGTTWQPLTGGLPEGFANVVAADPLTAGHALADTAAISLAPFAGQGPLWRTTTAGATWSRASSGLNGVAVTDIAPAPKAPRTVLAATQFDAVQRSTDGGATWTTAATGLPGGGVDAVAFDGGRAGTAYAGVSSHGIYRSTDAGETWAHLAGSPSSVGVLAADPARPGTIYGGEAGLLAKSTDFGAGWASLPTAGLPVGFTVTALAADPDAPGAVYAAGLHGVVRLAEGAASWQSRSVGLGGVTVEAIAFDPRSRAMLAATSGGGVYRSLNRGASWAPATNGIAETFVDAVVYDPQLAGTAYAGTVGGVYRTTNGGTTWARLTGGVVLPNVTPLRFDADGRTLYGGTAASGVVARTRGVRPRFTRRPAIVGAPRGGRILRGRPGAVDASPLAVLRYAWQRCNAAGRACRTIPGSRALTHRVVPADGGHRLRLVVTARNVLGTVVAASAVTGRARTGPGVAARPRLVGRAQVGARLRARVTVVGFPAVRVRRQWQRCGVRGRGCVAIAGATGARYVAVRADRGHRLRLVLTLRNALGRAVVRSALSAVVR